jgi:exopolysaccharide production protein ExoY
VGFDRNKTWPRRPYLLDENDAAIATRIFPALPNYDLGKTYAVGGRPKRVFDYTAALFATALAVPFLICVALVLKLTERGPVLYKHQRVGLGGRLFSCFKIRTMVVDAEGSLSDLLGSDPVAQSEWLQHQKLIDDPRVTAFGRFLRRSSLDELPQLINVLRGEMSLVGPRPVAQEEIWRYGNRLRFYLCARPGLTGLWQISGRSDCDYAKRVELDANYVSNWRFSTDLFILLRTVSTVLNRTGSY